MNESITVFFPFTGSDDGRATIREFLALDPAPTVVALTTGEKDVPSGCLSVQVEPFLSSEMFIKLRDVVRTPYFVLITQEARMVLGQFCLERLYEVAESTNANLVFSDYCDFIDGVTSPHALIDYQEGSIRDDFNFGTLLLVRTSAFLDAADEVRNGGYSSAAGWYALRLGLSRKGDVVHIPERLYTRHELDTRKSGEKQFDYVDPQQRAIQIEMEHAATEHLKHIHAYLPPVFEDVDVDEGSFRVEASVVIPVKDRVRTIRDAISSVLVQQTAFSFNIVVVDNHSTDGTSEIIAREAMNDRRIVHIVPERKDLGIGGCWNVAVQSVSCGRYAVQLDSDDLYASPATLAQIVDEFRRERCAMVIGSYRMTNFDLLPIPPGVVDHKEWSDANGRNNALRINGFGAPRAFVTRILRATKIPNVSYGEDYAVALAIARRYRIARIYSPLYLCRRWEGNSDADLDVAKQNAYNAYKDAIRTWEIRARKRMNKS